MDSLCSTSRSLEWWIEDLTNEGKQIRLEKELLNSRNGERYNRNADEDISYPGCNKPNIVCSTQKKKFRRVLQSAESQMSNPEDDLSLTKPSLDECEQESQRWWKGRILAEGCEKIEFFFTSKSYSESNGTKESLETEICFGSEIGFSWVRNGSCDMNDNSVLILRHKPLTQWDETDYISAQLGGFIL